MVVSTIFTTQVRRTLVAFGLVLALLVSAMVPAIASAAQLTGRSISLSSSSKSAEDVTYTVTFKADGAAGAFVVDFCTDSPILGQDCTPPAGMSTASASSLTSGFTTVASLGANTVQVTGTIAEDATVTVAIDNIDNPSAAGMVYARIVTFNNSTNAALYTEATTEASTGVVDYGGAAISITDTVGVSGAVLESLIFCVSGAEIGEDCDVSAAPEDAPTLKLGETTGDIVALTAGVLSTGNIYTQLSTNASTGAVVNLKSSAIGCGGLIRAGANTCDILPALDDGVVAGEAKFGVRTATATDTPAVTNAIGTLQPASGSIYNNTTYAMNYIEEDATGVTSTFGDPFLDTNNAPANNKNMQLTFGVSINNSTPAGLYSADFSLIATGKF